MPTLEASVTGLVCSPRFAAIANCQTLDGAKPLDNCTPSEAEIVGVAHVETAENVHAEVLSKVPEAGAPNIQALP
jgi:hypothetical protein